MERLSKSADGGKINKYNCFKKKNPNKRMFIMFLFYKGVFLI